VFSRYGTGPGGIYFRVEPLSMYLMWPNHETPAYYNGYWWSHRTDDLGFRNLGGRPSDVVLHGDSMIYGHGVDTEDVVSEVLHARHGWNTYNIAQQGDCLYQGYVKLRLYLDELSPNVVLHFAFLNDVRDLELHLPEAELTRLGILERDDWPALRREVARLADTGPRRAGIARMPAVRFPGALWREVSERLRRRTRASPDDELADPLLDPDRYARATRYYERVLADLDEHVRDANAELVVVNLDVMPESHATTRARFRQLLQNVTARTGVSYLDTGRAFADCTDCTLENDGHLSPKGHALLAQLVDGWLREIDPEGGRTAPGRRAGR